MKLVHYSFTSRSMSSFDIALYMNLFKSGKRGTERAWGYQERLGDMIIKIRFEFIPLPRIIFIFPYQ